MWPFRKHIYCVVGAFNNDLTNIDDVIITLYVGYRKKHAIEAFTVGCNAKDCQTVHLWIDGNLDKSSSKYGGIICK